MTARRTIIDILRSAETAVPLSRFKERGVEAYALRRMVESGEIENPARGLYLLPGMMTSQHADWALVSLKVPGVVIGLMSAAAFHDLTQDMPEGLTLFVDHASRRHIQMGEQFLLPVDAISTRRSDNLLLGVHAHSLDGVPVNITTPERTLVDMFRFSPFNPSLRAEQVRVGEEAFLDMLSRSSECDGFDFDEVRSLATAFGCSNQMKPFTKTVRYGHSLRA